MNVNDKPPQNQIYADDIPNSFVSARDYERNGRVDLMTNGRPILPQLDSRTDTNSGSYREALTGHWEDTLLSTVFFSNGNIQILHNAMRAGVYERSGNKFVISEQDTDTLKVIMRSVYLQHAKNRPDDIQNQVSELNQVVTVHCTNQLMGEFEGYVKYKSDASSLVIPLELPMHFSKTRTLEERPFF